MPNPGIVVAGIGAGSSLLGAKKGADAASAAASAQLEASKLGIAEQRRQFDKVQKLLAPFVAQGTSGLRELASLAGVRGDGRQQDAIDGIMAGPEYQTAMDTAQDTLLANASATGGLRGGNTQRALAELGPAVLSGMIERQYGRLGNLAAMGQNAAAGVGTAAQATGDAVSSLLAQGGAAQAGGALAAGQAWQQGIKGVNQAVGYLGGLAPEMPEGAGIFDRWGF
jgi:hypothetical protein